MNEERTKYANAVLDVYHVSDYLIPELLTQINAELSLKSFKKEPELFAKWFANIHKLKLRELRQYSFDALEALYGLKTTEALKTLELKKLIDEVSKINQ